MAIKYTRYPIKSTTEKMLEKALALRAMNLSNDTLIMLSAMGGQKLEMEKAKSALLNILLSAVNDHNYVTRESHEAELRKLEEEIYQLEQSNQGRSIDEHISASARKSALMRHAPNRERKAKIIEYCQHNIADSITNEDAARRLAIKFPGLAHRTLVKYVGEARKGLQPASTL